MRKKGAELKLQAAPQGEQEVAGLSPRSRPNEAFSFYYRESCLAFITTYAIATLLRFSPGTLGARSDSALPTLNSSLGVVPLDLGRGSALSSVWGRELSLLQSNLAGSCRFFPKLVSSHSRASPSKNRLLPGSPR